MPTPLAPIDHVKMLQGEAERSSKLFDPFTEFSLRERGELVEQRLDEYGVDELHDKTE